MPIPTSLTDAGRLPAAPQPAIPFGQSCDREAGCFSNAQVEAMLNAVLDGYARRGDNLGAIRRASDAATKEPAP